MTKNLINKNSIFKLIKMLDMEQCEKEVILKHLQIALPTFYKNIQKIKQAGFKIEKKNNIYLLKKYKNILKLENNEKSTIAYMLNMALMYLPKYKFDNFQNFINKFLLMASECDYLEVYKKFRLIRKCSLIEKYEEKIDTLEIFILKKEKAKITLRSNRKILIRPLRFDWKKDSPELHYINLSKNTEEKINVESIAKIENPNTAENNIYNNEIIFELYDTLAKRYLLKKEERIVKNTKNSLIIASSSKDKQTLFKRLLRYDTLCKILFPKNEVDEFNKIIDKAIINIDSMG